MIIKKEIKKFGMRSEEDKNVMWGVGAIAFIIAIGVAVSFFDGVDMKMTGPKNNTGILFTGFMIFGVSLALSFGVIVGLMLTAVYFLKFMIKWAISEEGDEK